MNVCTIQEESLRDWLSGLLEQRHVGFPKTNQTVLWFKPEIHLNTWNYNACLAQKVKALWPHGTQTVFYFRAIHPTPFKLYFQFVHHANPPDFPRFFQQMSHCLTRETITFQRCEIKYTNHMKTTCTQRAGWDCRRARQSVHSHLQQDHAHQGEVRGVFRESRGDMGVCLLRSKIYCDWMWQPV